MATEFYERPMVARLKRIFGETHPPNQVTQKQFDGAQDLLRTTAAKQWHEIDESDYWHYLLDLCYVDLQQDLFDHLFPAFLIKWWEGQLNRLGGPYAECDFYRAIDGGQVLTKMLSETRRQRVLDWIADAYIEGVDAWSNHLSVARYPSGPGNLHGPLWSFNALGQSVPVIDKILGQLADVSTLGRAQWWLVFASGLVWNPNECPWIPIWTPHQGGGGSYIIESEASIFDHGFLPDNLESVQSYFTYSKILPLIEKSADLFPTFPHGDWARQTWEECFSQPRRIHERLDALIRLYGLPNLGGVLDNPLDASH